MTNTPRLTNYLDTDSELVFYCPECAEPEFGESVSAAFVDDAARLFRQVQRV